MAVRRFWDLCSRSCRGVSSFLIYTFTFLITHSSFLILLTSCEYKELCYDHNHWAEVNIVFDWSIAEGGGTKASFAPAAISGTGMTVLFYNMDAPMSEPLRYDLTGRDGGTVRLLPGTYRALAYNYDTETILYRNMNVLDMLEAYTRPSSIEEGTQLSRSRMPRATNTESEPVILEPDPLWAAASEPFTLKLPTSSSTASEEATTIVMYPTPRYREVTVTINNVPNLQYTGQFAGALSGVAPSVIMETGEIRDGKVTEAFTAQVKGQSTLQMTFRIFGHCPYADANSYNPHYLTIYAILADGTQWYYTFDITEQMHNKETASDTYDIEIELEGLPVPKPIVNGSGFQPTVDSWQGIEIDVGM